VVVRVVLGRQELAIVLTSRFATFFCQSVEFALVADIAVWDPEESRHGDNPYFISEYFFELLRRELISFRIDSQKSGIIPVSPP
jgi:hypothetical protein